MDLQKMGKMKLSDYIVYFLEKEGVGHIFLISGQGNLHLIDSISRSKKIKYITTQHEQAAATAAESYAKATNNLGVAVVTSGPGGTNATTGVAGAWLDSVPVLYISGQVNFFESIRKTGVRQFGVQEINIIDIMNPITKYAVIIDDPKMISYHLQKALYLAKSGRPGPVWLDIPLNIQHTVVDPKLLDKFTPPKRVDSIYQKNLKMIENGINLMQNAKRPVLLAGAGIKRASAQKEFAELVRRLQWPIATSYSAADLIHHNDPLSIGRPGINGARAPNFAVQNCDLLLSLGSRLNITQTSNRPETYARAAKKIIVDIDPWELSKDWVRPTIAIESDVKIYLQELLNRLPKEWKNSKDISSWRTYCKTLKKKYSPVLPEYKKNKHYVNSFIFVDALSDEMDEGDMFIHDMGTAFSCTMQTLKVKTGQYISSNYGLANMGYSVPAAIGTWFALGKDKKKIVVLAGDGSLQMTIGELQTLIHYKIPIKLFIFNNRSYLTIKHTQETYFGGNFVDSTPDSGYSNPDFGKIAKAYGFKYAQIKDQKNLKKQIRDVFDMSGGVVCEVMMSDKQQLIPKLTARKVNGKYVQTPLEEMYPFLPREEFLNNMIVEPLRGGDKNG